MKIDWKLISLLGFVMLLLGLPVTTAQQPLPQPLPQTLEQLEQLPAQQRNELQKAKVRFEQLDAETQQRYRDFNARLNASPKRERLRQVMQVYTQWLLEMDSVERNRILALPLDQRLTEVIRKVKQEQAGRR